MSNLAAKFKRNLFYKKVIKTIVVLTGFFILSSLRPESLPEKIKSRFPSMLLDKVKADSFRKINAFDHFIFQLTGSDKSGLLGKRRVYTLIMYAIDNNGNPIDPNPTTKEIEPTQLDEISDKPDKDVTDRNIEIKISSYKMSKRQYDELVKPSGTNYLRFDPSIKPVNNIHVFKGYITYEVYPLTNKKDKISIQLTDDNYLKPSQIGRAHV